MAPSPTRVLLARGSPLGLRPDGGPTINDQWQGAETGVRDSPIEVFTTAGRGDVSTRNRARRVGLIEDGMGRLTAAVGPSGAIGPTAPEGMCGR